MHAAAAPLATTVLSDLIQEVFHQPDQACRFATVVSCYPSGLFRCSVHGAFTFYCTKECKSELMKRYYEVFTEPSLEDCQQRCAAWLHWVCETGLLCKSLDTIHIISHMLAGCSIMSSWVPCCYGKMLGKADAGMPLHCATNL